MDLRMSIRVLMVPLLAVLLLFADAHAQHSTRTAMLNMVRYQDRMITDTFSINDYTLLRLLNVGVVQTDEKLRPQQKFDTIWTIAGTNSYLLNSDCHIRGVVSVKVLIDSASGKYQSARNIENRDIGQMIIANSEETPWYFYTYGGYVVLDPTPMQTYRCEIEYESRSVAFKTTDSDTADTLVWLAPEFEQLVIDYTRYLLKKRFDLPADAELTSWKNDIAEARVLLQNRVTPMVSPQKERGQ